MPLEVSECEADAVIVWRVEILIGAGYTDEQAVVLAQNTEVDLHRAVDLLERGCPAHIAFDILS